VSRPCGVMTHDRRLAERLIADGAKVRRKGERGEVPYWILECPRAWRRGPKKPKGKNLTEAARKALGERLVLARAKRKAA